MTPDSELLRRFAKTNSEDAFAELVKRHVNLVYSAALRQVNSDAHLAKDVAQTVFTDLARKAGSLSRRETLTGWLYTSAHFAAAKMVRGENRRRDREEKFMREPINETEVGRVTPCAPDWEQIRPALDDAMHELKESDREAVLLRYFENRQFAEVGAKLGLNENAARMRVERALEKLRTIFVKRGITTATAFASVISANAIQMAPANLAATLTTASIATVGTGTFTLLKIMTATKIKLAISAIVVAGAATAIVVQQQTQNKLRAENESLTQQIAQLQTDNENFSNRLAEIGDAKKLSDEQLNKVSQLRQQTNEIGSLLNGNGQPRAQIPESPLMVARFNLHRQSMIMAAESLAFGFQIFAHGHNGQYPTNFDQLEGGKYIPGGTNFVDGIGFSDFEFVDAGLVNSDTPDKILLRESRPRQTPDGKWERVYVMLCERAANYEKEVLQNPEMPALVFGRADGSVQIQTSDDGNFDAWEQQHMVSPPNQ